MRRLLLAAALALVPLIAHAQSVGPTCTLSWTAPTLNADGTPLAAPVSEYRIYVSATASPVPALIGATNPPLGSVSGLWRVSAPATTFNCAQLGPGPKFVWLTAYNGTESAVSTTSTAVPPVAAVPLQFTLVGIAPASPSGLRVTP